MVNSHGCFLEGEGKLKKKELPEMCFAVLVQREIFKG